MTILDDIVEYKTTLIEDGYYKRKLTEIKSERSHSKRSFISALEASNHIEVIAEIKSKSPSVKDIPTRNLVEQVKVYEAHGAKAISILTDEKYFSGSFERLMQLRQHTDLPILCKDFIVDTSQIDVAHQAGADIILLIVHILTDAQLELLYNYALEKDLEVLVEVHDKQELERAHQLNPRLIGVNNRDLKTFITDVQHTKHILNGDLNSHTYYISESGIQSPEDIAAIIDSGISGVLMGEALMRSKRLDALIPQLRQRI
ncbi:indole-3-glycerol phosphate synthase TrpC [Staphylococcus massiliensis]|uniref:Indole-3-glycerol phosphate synthase n=1 Tax=Staphylococcus massiliensis S46 TaxID=1229783 RepID=K9AWZ3_9STAP|nr:indole-3-glycerol phosphate synthase TrpC [Staphylococcus massiliensis]EKU47092.1 indole-3-glycerol-phosphate synthase [Staphylococcus massiliensis S46]MCG3398615.1 indole-3-glycerol phosphate synthase TrpC [Staphylococcus massiliensis]MCG3401179.1 indole-3-glycerol phosphate synthase TrpC [Staphylococcus massiliensis]PNZ98529.1 indole-3-glycerol phosphate synthase TrpC [Staphylococcus massiliensis CCUG 55927]